jgi:hypothetical protein
MKSIISRTDQFRSSRGDFENESKPSRVEPAEPECVVEKEDVARLMKKLLDKK